ncbi:MAG: hypothetical protein WBC91_05725 [Phototrophicaceae bacterium]
MSVQSKWYDEAQTIIRYTFEDQWTWDDYNAALNHCRALLDTVNYPVDLIYDFNHAPTPPRNLVTRFWQVSMTRHQNISGLIVVLGSSKLMQMLTSAVGGLISRSSFTYDVSYLNCPTRLDEHLTNRRVIHRAF